MGLTDLCSRRRGGGGQTARGAPVRNPLARTDSAIFSDKVECTLKNRGPIFAVPSSAVICGFPFPGNSLAELGRELINGGQIPFRVCCVATSGQLLGGERTQLSRVSHACF
jgi:hypothetical protein